MSAPTPDRWRTPCTIESEISLATADDSATAELKLSATRADLARAVLLRALANVEHGVRTGRCIVDAAITTTIDKAANPHEEFPWPRPNDSATRSMSCSTRTPSRN